MEEQAEQDQNWWQKHNKLLMRTVLLVLLAVVIVLIILIILGYVFNWDWTGLNATDFTSTPQDITRTIVYQPEKTLWDWLQLLIIPAVLAIGGLWFSQIQKDREQKATEQRAQTEQTIAEDNQQETALQEYINKMSELLLDRDLCKSTVKDEVQKIARVRTLTVLPRLNGKRKGIVLQFLYEAKLINKGGRIVDLDGTDLTDAYLHAANLSGAHLSGAYLARIDLRNADLSRGNLSRGILIKAKCQGANLNAANLCDALFWGADLMEANLKGADLSEATLLSANMYRADLIQAKVTEEQLNKARSLKGATMPDGSIHP